MTALENNIRRKFRDRLRRAGNGIRLRDGRRFGIGDRIGHRIRIGRFRNFRLFGRYWLVWILLY